jgi:hypothetical protein
MRGYPCFAGVLEHEKDGARHQEKHENRNHPERDGRRIAALRRFARAPAFVAVSPATATRGRLYSSTSAANVNDDDLSVLAGRCPGHEFPSKLTSLPHRTGDLRANEGEG